MNIFINDNICIVYVFTVSPLSTLHKTAGKAAHFKAVLSTYRKL